MAVLYEYNYDEADVTGAYGSIWDSQTFTPQESHTVTSVNLKVYKIGTGGGTYTVSIRATSSGLPTGADLCSGTFLGGDQTTDTGGAVVAVSLGAGTSLTASTKYAIVWRGTLADVSNRCYFKMKESPAGSYVNGSAPRSLNSGVDWVDVSARDHWFEEYSTGSASISPSTSLSTSPSASLSASPSVSISASPSQSPSASISPSISPSASPSVSLSGSPSSSPSSSPSQSPSTSLSASPSVSLSVSPSISLSASPSISPSPSPGIQIKPVVRILKTFSPKINVTKPKILIK